MEMDGLTEASAIPGTPRSGPERSGSFPASGLVGTLDPDQCSIDVLSQLGVGQRGRLGLDPDQVCAAMEVSAVPTDLTQPAASAVAHDGVADPPRYGETDPGNLRRSRHGPLPHHVDGTTLGAQAITEHVSDRPSSPEPPDRCRHRPRSRREPGAALPTSGLDHGTAGPGCHPMAKPVLLRPPPVVRLVGALHDVILLDGRAVGRRLVLTLGSARGERGANGVRRIRRQR